MLEQMRNLSSVFSKTLLGIIALSFILFYGYSTISRKSGQGGALIAKVNDQGLPAAKFAQGVQNQTAMMEQFGQKNLSPEMQQMLENQVLQRLITNTLFAQAAYRLGLRVPDVELAQEIRQNPNFRKDGRFNESFYLDQFKPWYERQNGSDFEFDLRQDLLADKLKKVIENAAVVSQQEVETQALLQNTQLKLQKLTIPLQPQGGGKSLDEAKQLAKQWIAAKQEKKPTEELLKAQGLKEEGGEAQTLVQLQGSLGREDSLPILTCLLALQPGETCAEPFQVQDTLVAVQLIERKDAAMDAEKLQAMKGQLEMGQRSQLLSGVADLLTKQATIHTYLSKAR
ncbi:MAG: SurA N-terminal domain-containing protein [bacterium]